MTHFLILDDESFWKWNWLKPHVVTTAKRLEDEEGWYDTVYGLSDEFVEPAIKILTEEY